MIKIIKFTIILLIYSFLIINHSKSLENKILFKVNDEIITSYNQTKMDRPDRSKTKLRAASDQSQTDMSARPIRDRRPDRTGPVSATDPMDWKNIIIQSFPVAYCSHFL